MVIYEKRTALVHVPVIKTGQIYIDNSTINKRSGASSESVKFKESRGYQVNSVQLILP